jgi:chorismate mutase-like protein
MRAGPILIGGDHRSGTTLVSVVLDSHPELAVGPELDFLEPVNLGPHVLECCDLIERGDERVAGPGVQTRDPAYALGVQFVRQCHRFGVELADLRYAVEQTMAQTGDDLAPFRSRCTLIDALGESRRTRRRWGIKIQRWIARASAFGAFWRTAQFVHVVRDGRDVAASQLRADRGWGYRDVREAALGWVEVVESRSLLRLGDRVYTLRYEDLVADPRASLAGLLRFLGLEWNEAVLAHHAAPHSLFVHPYEHPSGDEVREPIHSRAVGRYVHDLSAAERSEFEAIAGAALVRYGYASAGFDSQSTSAYGRAIASEPALPSRRAAADAHARRLAPYRAEIDAIDEQLVDLLARRHDVCREVAALKSSAGIPMMQSARIDAIKERCARLGAEAGLDPAFVERLFALIIDEACELEQTLIDQSEVAR